MDGYSTRPAALLPRRWSEHDLLAGPKRLDDSVEQQIRPVETRVPPRDIVSMDDCGTRHHTCHPVRERRLPAGASSIDRDHGTLPCRAPGQEHVE